MSELPRTDRTTVRRRRERGSHDRAVIHAILDEGLVCHVGFTDPEGHPVVIPMAYGRRGDHLLLHGSVASRLMRRLADGAEVCVTVTLVDGLVLARSTFHSSMNYRSVVVFGRAREVTDEAGKAAALAALTEHLAPGRGADARGPTAQELAATTVLELPLGEASAKMRGGPPKDAQEDYALPVWAGVVPLSLAAGTPEPDPRLPPSTPLPDYLHPYRRP